MTYTQLWYFGGQFLGESQREDRLVHATPMPPESIAYFCPTCGEVWARIVVAGQPFRVWSMSCEKHPPPFRVVVAGSLLLDWDREHNDSLPERAWRREVLVHAAWAERQNLA